VSNKSIVSPPHEDSSRIFPLPRFTSPAPPPHVLDEETPPMLIHSIGCPFACEAEPPTGLIGGPCDVHCPCYRETPEYEQHPCYGVDEQSLPVLNSGHCLTTIVNYCCWDDLAGKMLTEMRKDLQFCRNLNYHKETNAGYECPQHKTETCGDTWMAVMPNANHSMYLNGGDCGVVCSPSMSVFKNNKEAALQWQPVMVHGSYFILRHSSEHGKNCLTNGMSGLEIAVCGMPGDEQLWHLEEKTGAIEPKLKDGSKKCLAGWPVSKGHSLTLVPADYDSDECVDKTGLQGESTSWVICVDIEHCDHFQRHPHTKTSHH